GADDEIVPGTCLGRGVTHVQSIVSQRSGLVAVITAGDGQNGNRQARVLLRRRIVAIPESVRMRMLNPPLEDIGRVADQRVKLLEWRAGLEPALVPGAPEQAIAENIFLR